MPEVDTVPGTIMDILSSLRGGKTHEALNKAVRDCVAASQAHGKQAKITLSLTIGPADVGSDYTMLVKDKVDVKLPEAENKGTIMFATNENKLVRQDPGQMELDMSSGKVSQMPNQ